MKHIGDLKITEDNQDKFKKLKEVTGYLYISSNATLPALTSVGGYLYISSNATLPALTSVGGYLDIYSNATLQADALTSVGGNLYTSSNATLQADALTSVGGNLYISSNATLKIPSLKKVNWKSIDKRLFVIESSKTSKGIKIHSGYNVNGIEKNKHIKEICFVAEKGDFYAHGLTVKKAIQDLQFKIVAEKLKHEPIKKDTLFTVKYYRLLTGSCDHGCRSWMSQNNISFTVENDETVEVEPIRADKLLPMLEKSNAYGLEKIKQLITF